VPSTRRTRTIRQPPLELWETIRDPHHLPRWWPRVTRVESVEDDAFTQVLKTSKGHTVRADFRLTDLDEAALKLTWEQQLENTPFGRLLKAAQTEVSLQGCQDMTATEVTIALHQTLHGLSSSVGSSLPLTYAYFPRLGSFLIRRAAAATLEEALDGLERIAG
jgi:uncharacterized protein YndB with AHSA1/START domain